MRLLDQRAGSHRQQEEQCGKQIDGLSRNRLGLGQLRLQHPRNKTPQSVFAVDARWSRGRKFLGSPPYSDGLGGRMDRLSQGLEVVFLG